MVEFSSTRSTRVAGRFVAGVSADRGGRYTGRVIGHRLRRAIARPTVCRKGAYGLNKTLYTVVVSLAVAVASTGLTLCAVAEPIDPKNPPEGRFTDEWADC